MKKLVYSMLIVIAVLLINSRCKADSVTLPAECTSMKSITSSVTTINNNEYLLVTVNCITTSGTKLYIVRREPEGFPESIEIKRDPNLHNKIIYSANVI